MLACNIPGKGNIPRTGTWGDNVVMSGSAPDSCLEGFMTKDCGELTELKVWRMGGEAVGVTKPFRGSDGDCMCVRVCVCVCRSDVIFQCIMTILHTV